MVSMLSFRFPAMVSNDKPDSMSIFTIVRSWPSFSASCVFASSSCVFASSSWVFALASCVFA